MSERDDHGSSSATRPSGGVAVADAPGSAFVTFDGGLLERHDGRGRRALDADPALVRHVRAVIACGLGAARFLWLQDDGRRWLEVRVAEAADMATDVVALVELRVVAPPHGLTPRELDVLTLVAGGLGNAEVAAHLGTRTRTVSTQVASVLAKLDQASRAGAAALAVEHGLVRLPVPGGGHSIRGLAVGAIDLAARAGAAEQAGPGAPSSPDPSRSSSVAARRRPDRRPFLVGSVLPLSGPMGADGREMRNGAQLAIAELNARGGIAGRRIEQVALDVDIDSAAAVEGAIAELVAAEVDAITTGYTFAADPARYGIVTDYGCPLLTTETSEMHARWVRADRDRFGGVFQVGPTEEHYGTAFVGFLDDLVAAGAWTPPNRRLIVVETDVPGGHVLTPQAADAIEASGWEVDELRHVGVHGVDWASTVRRIHDRAPAAVMLAHFVAREVAGFTRAFAAEPSETLLYGVYAPSVPEYLELAGPAAEGVVWATVTGSYGDRIGAAFAARYRDAYGAAPGRSQAGLSYDQIALLSHAWARVGNPRAFASVGDELRRVTHRGVNGTYAFGLDDQCGSTYPYDTPDPSLGQAHLVFQVQDGEHRIVHPTLYAEREFRLPPWFAAARAPYAG